MFYKNKGIWQNLLFKDTFRQMGKINPKEVTEWGEPCSANKKFKITKYSRFRNSEELTQLSACKKLSRKFKELGRRLVAITLHIV